jgi:hypothetical protein
MKLEYRILKKEKGSLSESCNYCVYNVQFGQDITYTPASHELVAYDNDEDCADIGAICDNCKKDFDNGVLPYCDECGRLKRRREYCICDRLENNKLSQGGSKTIEARLAKENKKLEKELKTAEKELKIEREEIAKFHEKSKE